MHKIFTVVNSTTSEEIYWTFPNVTNSSTKTTKIPAEIKMGLSGHFEKKELTFVVVLLTT